MRKEKGITLVSLVVTIIILIILAGVSINLTLGENGIITITKQAKENTELAKIEEEIALNELYMQMEAEGGSTSYDSIAKLTEFKKSIADYIEEAGGTKPEYTADATTFGESIKAIVKEVTKDATATAEDIANGKIAYVNGEKIIGNNNSGQGVLQLVTKGDTSAIIKNCDIYCGEWSAQTKATDGQILKSHTSWGGSATMYTSLIDLTNYSYIYYYSVPTSYGNYSWSTDGLYLIDTNNNAIAINKKVYSGFADIRNYNGEYKIQLSADCYAAEGYHSYLTLYYLYLISIPE